MSESTIASGPMSGPLSRRSALKRISGFLSLPQWAATQIVPGRLGPAPPAVKALLPSTEPARAVPSSPFGIGADRKLLDPVSHYRVPAKLSGQDRLCFDLSNNNLACSFNHNGLLERLAIGVDAIPVETHNTPVGAYVEKTLHRGGPWPMQLRVGDDAPVPLESLSPAVTLKDDLLPVFTYAVGPHRLRMEALTPQSPEHRPRAILLLFSLSSEPSEAIHPVGLLLSDTAAELFGGGVARALTAHHGVWAEVPADRVVRLDGSAGQPVCVALLFASNAAELANTRADVTSRPPLEWLSILSRFHRTRFGRLTIPDAPVYAALYTRAAELARQTMLLGEGGECIGSFNGSDLPVANNVWLRDFFYSALPQSVLDPDLCARAVLFLLQWSIPSHPLGEHAAKFPGADAVTNSLGNSVAGIVLAEAYFRNTADKAFFARHPEILTRSGAILERVLASRLEEVFLFPSIYVSDGESRGDFHTGSNIFLWRAMCGFARLAAECYRQPLLAAGWAKHADRLKEAILANCVARDASGPRLVEAALQDHTTIAGHDGEESDVTLAAFYDFCAEDDETYLSAAGYAVSPANPYAIAKVEGIWWYAHRKWSSATFPGWITALAASRTEAEMVRHLERIRSLTDADGSFWWWPYPNGDDIDVEHPLRTNSKCGWAAGTYATWFRRHLLGLQVDVPAATVRFAPFSPWRSFEWSGCRCGSTVFDCSYRAEKGSVTLSLKNAGGADLFVTLSAMVPSGASITSVLRNTAATDAALSEHRYGRPGVNLTQSVPAGSQLSLTVLYQ